MKKRFFYAFHNKIITFIISIVSFLVFSFLAYQIIYGFVRTNMLIERTLNESEEKFKLLLNFKLDLSDRIIRTLLNDDILTSAITFHNKEIIEKRLNFYNPIVDTFSIEVIDSQSNYYTNDLIQDAFKMNNQYRLSITKTATSNGGVFFLERESGLDIRYVMKRLHSNEILSVGFSIDRESFFINQLKNGIDADIILFNKNGIVTNSIEGNTDLRKKMNSFFPEHICQKISSSGNSYIDSLEISNILYAVQYSPFSLDRGDTDLIVAFAIDKKELIDNIILAIIITTVATVLVFLLVIFFSYYITSRMAKPLRMLTTASSRNANGEIVTVDYAGNNEIADLIGNYNTMILELKEKRDGLDVLIEERTMELYKKNNELKDINQKSKIELNIANKVHSLLSSESKVESEVLEISSMYIPVESEGSVQYNFYRVSDNKIGLLIFNLARIDLPHALLSSLIRLSFSKYSIGNRTLCELIALVNEELKDLIPKYNDGICLFYALVDGDDKRLHYINASCSAIFIQKKEGALIPLNSSTYRIGKKIDDSLQEWSLNLDQHDRLVYISGTNYSLESVIKRNVCKTSRDMINDLLQSITEENSNDSNISVLSSDFIFMKRESVIPPDLDRLRERLLHDLEISSDFETEASHNAFIKAIDAFELGKYDIAIREINRLSGRYTNAVDTFATMDLLAHSYYRLESFEEALTYWEAADKKEQKSYSIDKNIAILKGIIEEKKMRKR